MSTEATNGRPEAVTEHGITLELTVSEAQALNVWLVSPPADGSTPLDDALLKPVLLRLRAAIDYVDGVAKVREELEQAGLPTERLSDEQVADLGRRISEAPLRRAAQAA
jgi:hypothetical protein